MIDAHVHFWQLARGDCRWVSKARPVLYKDFLPEDFIKVTSETDVRACIAVQAAPTEAETEYLLKLSEIHRHIAGVTGWLDLTSPDVSQKLERLASHSNLVGIRPMPEVTQQQWLCKSEYAVGFEMLVQHDLVLEALALPHHVNAIVDIAQSFPGLRIVLNHAAKPEPKDMPRWLIDIKPLAKRDNAFCKVSGFTQQSSCGDHHKSVFDALLSVFGPERLLWGSDFPVLLETSDYDRWLRISHELWASLSTDEVVQITSGTTQKLYKLS